MNVEVVTAQTCIDSGRLRIIYIGCAGVDYFYCLKREFQEIALRNGAIIHHFLLQHHNVHALSVYSRTVFFHKLSLGDFHQCRPVSEGE